ncbi:MAG: hypothetical protein WCO16_01635 [bacterium]
MRKISVLNAQKYFSSLVDEVVETGEVIAIQRHNQIDALIVRFPKDYRPEFSDIANLSAYSTSFDFLKDEPDDYSRADIIHYYKK